MVNMEKWRWACQEGIVRVIMRGLVIGHALW
jgi:hypothetical protein